MKMNVRNWMLSTVLLLTTLTACHDDDAPDGPDDRNGWVVTLVGDSAGDGLAFSRLASYERLRVSIDGYDAERDGAVVITPTEDWLTVDGDTLTADSLILLQTTTNDDSRQRTASLVFSSAKNPLVRAHVEVSQLSKSQQDTNGSDAQSALYVGYGYDIYAALDNPMSVRTKRPIIDLENLAANSDVFNFEAIHDSRLSTLETNSYAATSIYEMATTLTNSSSNSDIEIAGCVQTCKRTLDASTEVNVSEQIIGYGVMMKTVASRALDKGALLYLRKYDEEDINSNRLSLSYEFKQELLKIRALRGDARRKKVTDLLLEYGTHIVLQADLGGKIDYTFTMDRSRSYRADTEVAEEVKYTVGQISKEDRTTGLTEVSSKKNQKDALQLWGGSAESRQLLQSDIKKLDKQGQIPPEHMQKWLASINYSAALANDDNLDVVHFELMPLWDLVPSDMRQDFLDATLLLAQRSDCQLPARVLGTDIYSFDPQKENDLFNFSGVTDDRSLCRLLYYEDEPVLQVCSEYVPKIRTDERVVVAYPIYGHKVRLNQGIFIGDGIHQPAMVSFSGSDSYINPIDTLKPGTRISRFYYVNGTLLMKNPSTLDVLKGRKRRVMDDVLMLYASGSGRGTTYRHPIVKIGSTFWTRHDINHAMLFAESADGKSTDEVHDGVLYAQFQWAPNSEFIGYNGWTWGYMPNTFFSGRPNTSWYLPTPEQVSELNAFLGFNPKALFKGQVSGFNAQFNGYYGWSDILSKNAYFPGRQREKRYAGELNVISSTSSTAYADACLLVLKPDYTMLLVNDKSNTGALGTRWRDNFFPVRPVRGWMFSYPTLAEITKNTR